MEEDESEAAGSGRAASRRRRDHCRQVLRDVPHPGLLPTIQETQGTDAQDASTRPRTHQRADGERYWMIDELVSTVIQHSFISGSCFRYLYNGL